MQRPPIILSNIIRPLVTGLVYYLLASLSLTTTMGLNGIATIWAPSGVLLAMLLLTPHVRWPGRLVACGAASIAANYSAGGNFLLACGFSIANLAEAVIVVRLLGRRARRFGSLGEPYRILHFAAAAGVGGLASATIATTVAGSWSSTLFASWATTVILGMLIVTPIILTTARHLSGKREPRTVKYIFSGVFALCMVIVLTVLVFSQSTYSLLFVPLAAVIMVTYLFGPPGAAASMFVIAVIGSIATANSYGPINFVGSDRESRVLFFQFFLLVSLLSSFPLAALLAQRARNLNELEHSNRMLNMAERAAHVGNWRLDLIADTLVWSAEVYRIHGRDQGEEIVLNKAIDAYHPDDRALVQASLQQTLETGKAFAFDARVLRPDGEIRHITSRGEIEISPHDGKKLALFGMIMDVTDKVTSLAEIHEAREQAEREAHNAAILAQTDQLTGLANRRKILSDLRSEIARADAFGEALTIAVIDVDHFKKINDTMGHAAGDDVLIELGRIFTRNLRKVDKVGRIGGEEFVIILPGTPAAVATTLAERLRSHISEFAWPDKSLDRVTVSIGIAGHSRGQDDRTLIQAADQALYSAKREGRNLLRVAA